MVVKKKREKVVKDHTTKNGVKKKREKSGEGPQKCAESLLISCVFFFSSTPTIILFLYTSLCGMVGRVWMRSSVWI